jgi:hypothetical protein
MISTHTKDGDEKNDPKSLNFGKKIKKKKRNGQISITGFIR